MKAPVLKRCFLRNQLPQVDAKLLDGESIRISDILSEALDGQPRLFIFLFVSKLRILRQLSGFLWKASLLLQGWWQNEREMPSICQQNSLLSVSQEACDAGDGR